jgi:hypothetical protein
MLFFVIFQSYFNFVVIFSKTTEVCNFVKIRTVGASLVNAEEVTDMTRLMVTFRNFAKAP